ncbi:histone acetyltransferase-like protein, partial [Chaetomium sp. MPI-SDFR-AT-0129]
MPAARKRKRHADGPETASATTHGPSTGATGASRRATRQSSVPPIDVPQDPEPRTRRRRRGDAPDQSAPVSQQSQQASQSPRGKENMALHPELQPHLQHQQLPPKSTTRLTRHSFQAPGLDATLPAPTNMLAAVPATTTMTTMFDAQQQLAASPRATASTIGPRKANRASTKNDRFTPHQQSVLLGRNKPIIMTTSVAQPGPSSASKSNKIKPDGTLRATAETAARPDRNIDKVVLGNICFRAWYPSYYGKEVLGDLSGGSTKVEKGTNNNGVQQQHQHQDANDGANGTLPHSRRDRDHHTPMLDRLYVCPSCFKYSKELVTWWEHVRWCERRGYLPGDKIYTHPQGRRTTLVSSGPGPKHGRGKRTSAGQKMVEKVVQDEGEWSIRQVDGEKDVLFCQNLSLFAKLFLDNKSVFFDVTGFDYFLLVHTPSAVPPSSNTDSSTYRPIATPELSSVQNSGTFNPGRSQIVGFFSKEKMSWDNNNLACILIFPPWQRKGLGALLMGISYEISRREGVLGGPEKPISDLGKKGYKRFWAGEVCRWLLGLNWSSSSPSLSSHGVDTTIDENETREIVVDVEACSQATWIAPEDCLLVLREMALAEDAGVGLPPPSTRKRHYYHHRALIGEDTSPSHTVIPGTDPAISNSATSLTSIPQPGDQQPMVPRVRISLATVRAWVNSNRISLERVCDPEGFIEGYATKKTAGPATSEEP